MHLFWVFCHVCHQPKWTRQNIRRVRGQQYVRDRKCVYVGERKWEVRENVMLMCVTFTLHKRRRISAKIWIRVCALGNKRSDVYWMAWKKAWGKKGTCINGVKGMKFIVITDGLTWGASKSICKGVWRAEWLGVSSEEGWKYWLLHLGWVQRKWDKEIAVIGWESSTWLWTQKVVCRA